MRRTEHQGFPTFQGPPSRRPKRRLPLLLLIVPLLIGLFGAPGAGPVSGDELSDAIARQRALDRQIAAQKAQVARLTTLQADLKGDIAATNRELAGINANLADVRQRINSLSARIEVVKSTYADLVNQLQVLGGQMARLTAEEEAKQLELEERKAVLAERIRIAYDTDRVSLLEAFLSGGSFTDVIAEVSYNIDVAAQDRDLAEEIISYKEQLASLHTTVVETRAATEALRKETEAQKAELDARMEELRKARQHLEKLEADTQRAINAQQAAFGKLKQTEAQLKKQIAEAAAAQKQLEARINRLVREQAARGRIPSKYNGTLAWPMSGRVTQNFGCTGFKWEPPLGNCAHFHRGIDIAAPMYTPIRAAGNGRVIFAGPNPYDRAPKAWIVIIAHSANLVTWYGHVDNAVRPPAVRAGQQVRKGQVIAYNGMTGRTTGPHLHWMVEHNNKFVNPRLFL